MSRHDFTQIKALYPQVIRRMRSEFTSHEFIKALAQQNQQLYIEALHTYRKSAAPFQTVHRILAQSLHNFVVRVGKVPSKDIWCTPSSCAKWRK